MNKQRQTWERLIRSDSLGIFDVHGVIADVMRTNAGIAAFDIPRAKTESDDPERDIQRLHDTMRENIVYAERITRRYICLSTGMSDASANLAMLIEKRRHSESDIRTILNAAIQLAESTAEIMKHTYGSQHRAPMRVARTRIDIGDRFYMMSRGVLRTFVVSRITILEDRIDVTVRCINEGEERWTITYDADAIGDYMFRNPEIALQKGTNL